MPHLLLYLHCQLEIYREPGESVFRSFAPEHFPQISWNICPTNHSNRRTWTCATHGVPLTGTNKSLSAEGLADRADEDRGWIVFRGNNCIARLLYKQICYPLLLLPGTGLFGLCSWLMLQLSCRDGEHRCPGYSCNYTVANAIVRYPAEIIRANNG